VKFGLHFPQAEIPHDFSVIRDFIQAGEAQGYHHLNVPDHVIQTREPKPKDDFPAAARYTTEFPHHEPMTLLAFAAGITSKIILKSAVLILPQRQAVLVAKQAAELDILSNGRLQLGVGIGWNDPEYVALDMDFKNRARRFEEQIEVCRLLWTNDHLTYEGAWHKIEDSGLATMPIQRPIPVWIGAFQSAAIARAARLGDGWQSQLPVPDEKAAKIYADFRQAVKDAGRAPDQVAIETSIFSTQNDPEAWRQTIQAWKDCGVTHIVFRPQGTFDEIQSATQEFSIVMKDFI